jgi:hypothetical protein
MNEETSRPNILGNVFAHENRAQSQECGESEPLGIRARNGASCISPCW